MHPGCYGDAAAALHALDAQHAPQGAEMEALVTLRTQRTAALQTALTTAVQQRVHVQPNMVCVIACICMYLCAPQDIQICTPVMFVYC